MTPRNVSWVFGYGSLVYRPGFEFEEQSLGRLDGWERRFWQGSTDHRGVPGAPGRVATLTEVPGGHVHGVAYRLAAAHREDILATLDHREKGGYARAIVPVHLQDSTVDALVYWADETNPQFLGPAPHHEMVRQIVRSRGPSGPNTEYVLLLESTLTAYGDHRSEPLTSGVRGAKSTASFAMRVVRRTSIRVECRVPSGVM